MVFQFFILCVVIFFAPLVPPVLSPLGFTMTAVLVAQKANPWIVSLVTIAMGVITSTIIRHIQNYVIRKLNEKEKIEGKNIFVRLINVMNSYSKNQNKINKLSSRRERYTKTRSGKIATFIFAIFCFLPVFPDIVSIRLLYRKIKFPAFILAVIIGKSISHIPIIFAGKSIIDLLRLWI